MRLRLAGAGVLLMLSAAAAFAAEDVDLAEGEKLYTAQCQICHGKAAAVDASEALLPARGPGMVLAAAQHGRSDVPVTLAFAPPFGPPLNGVYGRKAGSVPGFDYSSTLLATLKDLVWDDASLNVWITNPQAWVPGVYMFYKQPDAEIRRKIIAYLKANR
ncbi:MAG: hypothetical protein JNL33_14110 [Betaproteobacteria bacterium]|nr:hypothetical protein [Betaproteobacteria bacterium]MBL8534982.1 hypothetical protein [Betaproteobacteria bacterium]